MNSSTKCLKVVSRLPTRRFVSSIKPRTESVVYYGQTYTKMLYPHTLTARIVNYHWKLHWQKHSWFRCIVYATVLVMPFAIYTNYHVFKQLRSITKASKGHGH